MSGGPRVTSDNSPQDYGTPQIFLDAVEKRFGAIRFDLAAHARNKKHPFYFAPANLTLPVESTSHTQAVIDLLVSQGTPEAAVVNALDAIHWDAVKPKKDGRKVFELQVRNSDPRAHGFDSLTQHWHSAAPVTTSLKPLLWLNPEFGDIAPWALKCGAEAARGANIAMLVPASVGANWYRDHVAPHARTYFLNGRLMFDGKNLFPKDCLLAHFKLGEHGSAVWTWRTDAISNPMRPE